ncbi:MAG: response regulator [Oscillospiraceae bacterium]|nr:response regulator [Oscillospiraceae bacterium]
MEKKNSILIVDDEVANIKLLSNILTSDYNLFAVTNGSDAIEAAKKHSPDIILLDVIMPDMDGFSVMDALKDHEETKDIPVIIISGLGGSPDEDKGLSRGAVDYISKPFSPIAIKCRVSNQALFINMKRELEALKKGTGK